MTRFVHSIKGLGDNIYQRAFVRSLDGPVVIDTPWPQLYEDLPNVRCVRPRDMALRTQQKNVNAYRKWASLGTPRGNVGGIRPSYGAEGIYAGMRKAFGVEPQHMDLPARMMEPLDGFEPGRYVVVRPVTVRTEWRADARNPDPMYVAEAARMAQEAGYFVVSVADLEKGREWTVGELPPANIRHHAGELDVVQLMRLVANAAFVIGGIGWIVPAAMAAGVPAWIICGGQGGYNSPWQLVDHGLKFYPFIQFAVPDNFCLCKEKEHDCDKRISDHVVRFTRFREALRR